MKGIPYSRKIYKANLSWWEREEERKRGECEAGQTEYMTNIQQNEQ